MMNDPLKPREKTDSVFPQETSRMSYQLYSSRLVNSKELSNHTKHRSLQALDKANYRLYGEELWI